MTPPSDRALRWAAWLALVPWLAVPLYHPDLYWHLSAARRIAATGGVPRLDWLSDTRAGAPWIDFEWLPQLLFGATHSLGGMAALWLLKVALLLALAIVVWRWCAQISLPMPYRAAALPLLAAAAIPRSDLRPEALSVILLAALWRRLEGDERLSPAWTAVFFAIWANCHGGFAYGLLVLALYAARCHTIRGSLVAAVIGCLVQPTGVNAFVVLWRHWLELAALRGHILEWAPPAMSDPQFAAFWALWLFSLGAALLAARRWRVRWPALAGLALLAFAAAKQMRDTAYFAAAAPPLALRWASEERILPERLGAPARWALLLGFCGVAAFCARFAPSFGVFRTLVSHRFVPREAADFLDRESPVLAHHRLYNRWGWGGYFGWRLFPRYRVFVDGRYIFHPFLSEIERAGRSSEEWQAFLDRHGIEIAVMENAPLMMRTWRRYPDGTLREFSRPYYVLFMPRARWALVHFDAQALIFVRRGALDPAWLSRHEFRYLRPRDDQAFADALTRREIPLEALRSESARRRP